MTGTQWEVLADVLLQREALLCRLGEGVPPRDLAGWFVAPEDVDRILRTLPGLDGPQLSWPSRCGTGWTPKSRRHGPPSPPR